MTNCRTFLFILLAAVILKGQNNINSECILVMVGKYASEDGSVLVAHNNDLTGIEASLYEIVDSTVTSDSIRFPSGLSIPAFKNNFSLLMLRINKGFAEGDAIAINENMVAIGGGVALGADRNKNISELDTLVKKGLTGGVRYHALRNVKSARECVLLIGSLYTKYGVNYPSGVAIADTSEVWYLEAGGGKTWAAVRIPDSSYMVVANGYRIGEINFSDKYNFLTSPNLREFCENNGLCDSTNKSINFADIFGRGRENRYYDTRRVWRAISLLTPSANISPEDKTFPMFFKPQNKVDLNSLFSLLRDRYEGTPYSPDSTKGERLISSHKAVHSEVVQLNGSRDKNIGAVLWGGLSVPDYTVYLPFYLGINNIPFEFGFASDIYDARSAFWITKDFGDKVSKLGENYSARILSRLRTFEKRIINSQKKTRHTYLKFKDGEEITAVNYLTEYVSALAGNTIQVLKMIISEIEKINR